MADAFEKLRSWIARGALAVVLALSFLLMLLASRGDSAIMDELAHIPAGYSYARYLDYRLNPEHPPLVKVLAGFPLVAQNPNFPTGEAAWTKDVNGQWAAGNRFLYESGNNADRLIQWARAGPMLLTLLLILFIYLWSAELLGPLWALLPAFLFGLSPHVLAHGHYVTTDIAAAFGILLATYYFLKFLLAPSREHLFVAGVAFGVAQLTKFSALLLLPYFLFLIVVFYLASVARDWGETERLARFRRFGVRLFRYLRSVLLVLFTGYVFIVYPVYLIFTWNYPAERQTADTEFLLTSFAGGPTPEGKICRPMRCLAELDIAMTQNPLARPFGHYLLGALMVLQRSVGGNTGYFLGEVSAAGWQHYFPVVYLLKEPIPVLILILFALLMSFVGIGKNVLSRGGTAWKHFLNYLGVNFAEFSMLTFILLYWAWSIGSSLNIGFRHLMPTLPFLYILTASFWKRWVRGNAAPQGKTLWGRIASWTKLTFALAAKYVLLFVLLVWFFLETAAATPYFLSYFNQMGGGVAYGYRYVTDSNYDWGQDLLHLREFVKRRPEIDRIAVDYFGGGNPKYYLGEQAEYWSSARGNPRDAGIRWLAVSVNTLQGATQRLRPGQPRRAEDEYGWLTVLRPPAPGVGSVPAPDFRAGTSIFIYKL